MEPFTTSTYATRALGITNPTAKTLFQIMERKKTNLCVAVDVTDFNQLLEIAKQIGPFICVLKTHIDIIQDFTLESIQKLSQLAIELDFLLFEDRKFADIGNTVALQYGSGIYKIASWSHFTNAHSLPGDGIVQGLKQVGLPLKRGLLLLAEMSSKGCLADKEYKNKSMEMAERHSDFVFGFIGQERIPSQMDWIYMTPGVALESKGDALGQQYKTPRQVIKEAGCDVIIVGRGIYGSGNIIENAIKYKEAGWKAYEERIQSFI